MTDVEQLADRLTEAQRRVLCEMSDTIGYSAEYLAKWTGLTVKEVTASRRELHRMGIAEFGPLMDEYGAQVRGRGYWLGEHGCGVSAILRARQENENGG